MLERLDLERVTDEAQRVDIGRGLLTLLIGFFWVLGWLAAKAVIVVATVVSFAVAAMKVGWQDAHRSSAVRRRAAA